MQSSNPNQALANSPDQLNTAPQQAPAVPRGRARRQYAAQQYDFNAPAAPSMYNQQYDAPQYSQQGYQAGPAAMPAAQPGQPQGYAQPGYQYGQEYQQPMSPNMYQDGHQRPAGVAGMTSQFQNMQVSQPASVNPLMSVDLMNTAPDVASLYAPPPPLLLPHGSSLTGSDSSNCPSEYMRSTLGCIPQSNSLLKKTKLPFALTIRPYISLRDEENPVPVVSDTIIARCRRCRTYINPFVMFIENGNRWRCNMCGLTNETPQAYDYDPQTRQNLDRMQRSELRYSVVEFVAPTEYMVRPPQPLVYLFLIDVSFPAVTSGLVATATRTILESLDRIPNNDGRTKVGFIGVDSSLHYFTVSPGNAEPQLLVVGDIDDTFLPQPQDLLLNINECREGIEALLTRFNDMFQHNQNGTNALGSALKAAHKLISPIGGKVVCLMASLPNISTGKLTPRDNPQAAGTSKESALLQAQNSFYKSFAVECSKHQISVDMFLFSSNYQDVATLSCLPRYTGGQTFYYPGWSASRSEDTVKFANEFSKFLSMEIALEAVMRIRATSGLRMASFYGNFFNRSSDLCAFPAFPRDQGYVVEVAIDETITKPFVCLQAAILHSTCNGERRIRVLTMAIPTTTNAADVFASADQVAIATYMSSRAVEQALSSSLESARDNISNRLVDIFSAYKTNVLASNTGGSTPLQISANLKLLPLLSLGLLKNVGLKKSTQISSDMRAAALNLLSTLPPAFLVPYIHPRLYAIHEMTDEEGLPGPNGIVMPPALNLTSGLFKSHGLYLIDDGQVQFLWIGRDAVPQLIQDVFDQPSLELVKAGKATLPMLDNPFSPRVNAVLAKSREMLFGTLYYPHLYIVKEDGDPGLRIWAASTLIEDRSDQSPSYPQFLQHLREKVTN